MKTSSSAYLVSALMLILVGQPKILPAQAQGGSTAGERSPRSGGAQGDPRARADARDGPEAAIEGRELESILGREVRTREEDMGRIIDLLADRDGQLHAAVVELGGFLGIGTRKIAVEWPALRFESEGKRPRVILEMTREQLRLAPEYKPSEPVVLRRAAQ